MLFRRFVAAAIVVFSTAVVMAQKPSLNLPCDLQVALPLQMSP
jgi:hypothetical protein